MKRLKIIACKVLYREISKLSADHENILDTTFLRQGLHDTPDLLHSTLQKMIDEIDNGDDMSTFLPYTETDFDAILLGYGLCSNAIVGLSSKKYKIVVPRAHDCITLFLGSKEKHREIFDRTNGANYWYTSGWIDNTLMPGKDQNRILLKEYTEKYGEENAGFLLEMESNWMKGYTGCGFIDWVELENSDYLDYTKTCANFLKWEFQHFKGDSSLMRRFISGDWNEKDFLVINPNEKIGITYDDDILKPEM